jgi:uncharacterized phiE125 gp8 family phage protein
VVDFHCVQHSLSRSTDATSEPLTVADAMLHCSYDSMDRHQWFENAIVAARKYCEAHTKRQLISATWKLYLDRFPSAIELRVCPVGSVTSIKYNDTNGTQQTLSNTLYRTDLVSEPARIVPAYNQTWPSTRGEINDVIVEFVSGFGATQASVPQNIKYAMLMLIANWFENPEATTFKPSNHVAFGVNAMLDASCWSKVH